MPPLGMSIPGVSKHVEEIPAPHRLADRGW
jgi:hypothetical protein